LKGKAAASSWSATAQRSAGLAAAACALSPISADLTRAQADAVFLGERLAPVLAADRGRRRGR
jgi:hypothetical protein